MGSVAGPVVPEPSRVASGDWPVEAAARPWHPTVGSRLGATRSVAADGCRTNTATRTAVPSERSVIPTHRSLIPTHRSVIPTQRSVIPIARHLNRSARFLIPGARRTVPCHPRAIGAACSRVGAAWTGESLAPGPNTCPPNGNSPAATGESADCAPYYYHRPPNTLLSRGAGSRRCLIGTASTAAD